MVRSVTMPHPSSHRSQKENSTVEPKVGDLVNVIGLARHTAVGDFGYVVKVEHKFDQFDYSVYVFQYNKEFVFRKEQLEIV
jgi:hypothetical protein